MPSIISAVDKDLDSVFRGIKEFHSETIYFITTKKEDNQKILSELSNFKVKVEFVTISFDDWFGSFKILVKMIDKEKKSVVINTSLGSPQMVTLLVSLGYTNGVAMYTQVNDKLSKIPALNASYYDLLTKKKEDILDVLAQGDCCKSLDELSKRTKMSLPLISYHINGNLRTQGLKALGLVETVEEKGRVKISLSPIGKILVNTKN